MIDAHCGTIPVALGGRRLGVEKARTRFCYKAQEEKVEAGGNGAEGV